MPKKRPQLGNLPPRHNFFLNPYADARFSRCPQCEGKTGQKKTPLMIHVEPHYPININYTCRYCAKCDILIAHQNEIESLLAQIFAKYAPDSIGHDYLVMGTTERDYWKDGVDNPHAPNEVLDNLHGFKQYLNFEMVGGWMPDQLAPKPPPYGPAALTRASEPSGNTDNVKNARSLVSKMEASLPIPVRAGKELLKILRKQGLPISDKQSLSIRHIFYGGDEMGIACDVTPSGQYKQAVVCSLTHLEVVGNTPLAEEMRVYQEKRRKKLTEQDGFGLHDIMIRRKQ
jgi:hypothetical protein